jgi:hypothetical protein
MDEPKIPKILIIVSDGTVSLSDSDSSSFPFPEGVVESLGIIPVVPVEEPILSPDSGYYKAPRRVLKSKKTFLRKPWQGGI